jgi:hypothetical protein
VLDPGLARVSSPVGMPARHARQIADDLPVVCTTGGSAHEWGANGVPRSVLLIKL